MPAPPCRPGCTCRKHVRTPQHNARISMSNLLTVEAKRRAGEPVGSPSPCLPGCTCGRHRPRPVEEIPV